jgi:dTDP-4-dehydrorhamnose reductase
MRVLVTGAHGQLAGAVIESYKSCAEVFAYPRRELDISNFGAVMSRLSADRPDVVINCAA